MRGVAVFKRFWQSTSGNFAIMFSILLPVLLAAVGLALDVANLSKAKSDLQNALDSAVLAASRLSDQTGSRTDVFNAFFKTNIANKSALVNATAKLEVDQRVNQIRTTGTANADVALNFGFIFGKSARVSAVANAFESTARLEVALVLDNTGSMGATNMKALIEGAKDVVNALQKVKTDRPEREILAALVPFVTAVNIQSAKGFDMSWIDTRLAVPNDGNSSNGTNFNITIDAEGKEWRTGHWKLFKALEEKWKTGPKGEWKGCVEARLGDYALKDDAPNIAIPGTLFVPYFAPDEPGVATKAANSGTNYNNSYLDDLGADKNTGDRARQKSIDKYFNQGVRDKAIIKDTPNLTSGPNYACPTPVVPLTEDLVSLVGEPEKKPAVAGELDKMTFWNGSGTNVSEGLAWGYRVLSPSQPFNQGHPFKSQDTSKVVVVFTDGENNVFGASGAKINKSDYGSYGFLDQERMGSPNHATALTKVNAMTENVCIRLKNQGVIIYTVVLDANISVANRKLYSDCATTPANFFPTKNTAELRAAFQAIANSISPLYITN